MQVGETSEEAATNVAIHHIIDYVFYDFAVRCVRYRNED